MTTNPHSPERETKAEARRAMREVLGQMPDSDALTASEAICDRLRELLDGLRQPVLSFAPIRRVHGGVERTEEVDLGALHDTLIARAGLAFPRIDWEHRTMRAWVLPRAASVDAARDLETRRFEVPEPVRGDPVDAGALGAVLVPGLAFDRWGARLGRGAGFYDRFLEPLDTAPRVPRLIGVCFDEQVLERVPVEAHDRRVDVLVTPSAVIECEGSRS